MLAFKRSRCQVPACDHLCLRTHKTRATKLVAWIATSPDASRVEHRLSARLCGCRSMCSQPGIRKRRSSRPLRKGHVWRGSWATRRSPSSGCSKPCNERQANSRRRDKSRAPGRQLKKCSPSLASRSRATSGHTHQRRNASRASTTSCGRIGSTRVGTRDRWRPLRNVNASLSRRLLTLS
jgi:hypothetical protein